MVVYDSELVSFEPGTQSEQVQDANYQVRFVSNPTTRLVCDNRSKGYIFSHPDRQETQKIPQVRFRGQTLPVLCSSILAGSGPPNVHKVYQRSSGPTSAPGLLNFELPRRLADSNPIAGSDTKTSRFSAQSFSKPGTTYESMEECSATQPTNYVSGGFSYDAGMLISRTCADVTDLSQSVQDRASGAHGLMSQIIVYDVGSVPCSSVGPAPHATVSVVDQEPEGFISLPSALQDHCDAQGLPRSETVEKISVPPERSPVGSGPSSQDYNDRRIPYGLGGVPQCGESGQRNSGVGI